MAELDNTCAPCVCSICSGIRATVDQIFRALKIYGWVLDAYVVDFFQDDLWQKLPSVWRSFLDEVSPEELGRWILNEPEKNKKVWPLSLLALRRFVKVAEISRDHKKPSTLKCSASSTSKIIREDPEENPAKKPKLEEKKKIITAKDEQFDNLFTKHVKQKKRYEINVMSQIAADSAKKANCSCIVDIGSGMGHFARVLAYRHDLSVTCVEQNRSLLDGARKWDEQLSASLAKHLPDFRERKPRHVSLLVEASSAARRQLADQLTRVFGEDDNNNGFGLVGLHPCGDLAASLLRLYANEETARFICIVGCCYMKLTLSSEAGAEICYPMSRHLRAMSENCRLSYAALEVACHAVEKHCDKLKTNNYKDLIVHAYRAVLECLLVEKNPNLRHTQLKNTKLKDGTTFEEYCKAATENLEFKDRPVDDDFDREEVKSRLQQWKRVLVFGSLRLLLASLVETLVLFDRFLYLSELNLSPSLKSEFDARVSPRNILLVSVKERTVGQEYKPEQ